MKHASLAALAGALVAVVLGLLTVGVQATAGPRGLPVAVVAPGSGPLRAAAEHLAAPGGDQLSWRVTTLVEARKLLDDKEIYGFLELGVPAGVVLSGAINPAGTQVAQQVLTAVGEVLTKAPVTVETVHPASVAGRTAPLAVSILAWLGSLAAGALLLVLMNPAGRRPGPGVWLVRVLVSAVLMTAVVAGFLALWDSSLPMGWDVIGFVFLVALSFATVQGAVLRLLGIRGMAVLVPLYLVAPSVAGQVPEMLSPAYKVLLWSWTPFRFSTEGVRSLLQGVPGAPDVATGARVLAALLAAGLIVLLWPGKARQATAPGTPADPGASKDPGASADRPGAVENAVACAATAGARPSEQSEFKRSAAPVRGRSRTA